MLGYRLFVEIVGERRHVEKLAREQFHSWLRRKRYDADVLESGKLVTIGHGASGQLLELSRPDGGRAFRASLIEEKPGGRWVTRLTVDVPAADRRQPWLWLDVESPEERYTIAPKLAGSLLSVLEGRDGGTRLGPGPMKIGEDDVGAVVESVCDPTRRGLVFIAGSDTNIEYPYWSRYVDRLLKDTVGLSGGYVLDAPATAAFNNALGPNHAVQPWTVRTFRPGVEPDDPVDAARHRVLGLTRIVQDSDQYLARMLGRRAREAAVEAPLPKYVIRVGRAFEREIDERLVAPLVDPAPPPRPSTGAAEPTRTEATLATPAPVVVPRPRPDHLRTVPDDHRLVFDALVSALDGAEPTLDRVRVLLDLASLGRQARENQAAIAERLHSYEARVDELTTAQAELRRQLEDTQLELWISDEERAKEAATVRRLRKLLSSSGRAAEAWSEPEPDETEHRPDDYQVLLETLDQFEHVVFTGDRTIVRDLDQYDKTGVWAGKAWDILGVLDDYARASREGRCHRDVDGYLRNTPSGFRGYSAQRHARDESEDVKSNPRFRAARELPVPPEVNPAGKVFMGAHFKIATSGMISPRLHYFDDTARSGRVYVGYIGPHLPTKQTN
ncbi:hypothetical protein [Gandjariella thermophila]|uniref:Uncharacterized protein n=1 Tax=Gandjariella thermophila TaxID=1931992 RepID=A0A4D4JGK2_9PSEU|nr:hypothetical protein [Gandjariella thermophila]GDY33439.1 hypothetical protein GTS_50720 [Gandjariella thermophila]